MIFKAHTIELSGKVDKPTIKLLDEKGNVQAIIEYKKFTYVEWLAQNREI